MESNKKNSASQRLAINPVKLFESRASFIKWGYIRRPAHGPVVSSEKGDALQTDH